MLKVTLDENNYVTGWCMVGDNGGEEYDPPEDFDAFLDNCFAFKLEDGKLVRDTEKEEADHMEEQKATLRVRGHRRATSTAMRSTMLHMVRTI